MEFSLGLRNYLLPMLRVLLGLLWCLTSDCIFSKNMEDKIFLRREDGKIRAFGSWGLGLVRVDSVLVRFVCFGVRPARLYLLVQRSCILWVHC